MKFGNSDKLRMSDLENIIKKKSQSNIWCMPFLTITSAKDNKYEH